MAQSPMDSSGNESETTHWSSLNFVRFTETVLDNRVGFIRRGVLLLVGNGRFLTSICGLDGGGGGGGEDTDEGFEPGRNII